MNDDIAWKCRGPAFLRSLKVATGELRLNVKALKSDSRCDRDVVDPTSETLKRCFAPVREYELWCHCHPGYDPAARARIFGDKPTKQELLDYRKGKRVYKKLTDYVKAVEGFCRAGQVRFPVAASKYETIRLQVLQMGEELNCWLETDKIRAAERAVYDALKEISILTIREVLGPVRESREEPLPSVGKLVRRKREKCTSRFAGREIRNLLIAKDGVTFTVCREYVYKITAKQAILFLDKLIESYEKTNQPVKVDFQLASVFKRGDAMRLRKRFMVSKNGCVRLNIPN